jgi:hypothetical protein
MSRGKTPGFYRAGINPAASPREAQFIAKSPTKIISNTPASSIKLQSSFFKTDDNQFSTSQSSQRQKCSSLRPLLFSAWPPLLWPNAAEKTNVPSKPGTGGGTYASVGSAPTERRSACLSAVGTESATSSAVTATKLAMAKVRIIISFKETVKSYQVFSFSLLISCSQSMHAS